MRRSRRATVPLWAARQAVSVSISSLPPVCAALAGGRFFAGRDRVVVRAPAVIFMRVSAQSNRRWN